MPYVIINNELIPREDARIPVTDRGLKYGDGVFETIAVYNGVPYQLGLHIKRLKEGLEVLKINADIDNLREQSSKILNKNQSGDGILRITVTRGSGGFGYAMSGDEQANIIIETLPKNPRPDQPVKLMLSSYRKISALSLPVHIKTLQGLNAVFARSEAHDNGFFEALLLGTDDQICECSSSNIFWIKGDVLYTPSLESGILPGTTRDAVIRLSPMEVREGIYKLEDLEQADEIFITSISCQILPVSEIFPLEIKSKNHKKAGYLHDTLSNDINNTS